MSFVVTSSTINNILSINLGGRIKGQLRLCITRIGQYFNELPEILFACNHRQTNQDRPQFPNRYKSML